MLHIRDTSFILMANGMRLSGCKLTFTENQPAMAAISMPIGVNMQDKQDAIYNFDLGDEIYITYETSAGGGTIFRGTVQSILPQLSMHNEAAVGIYTIVCVGHLATLLSGIVQTSPLSSAAFQDTQTPWWLNPEVEKLYSAFKSGDFGDSLKTVLIEMLKPASASMLAAEIEAFASESLRRCALILSNIQSRLMFHSAIPGLMQDMVARQLIPVLAGDYFKSSVGEKLIQIGNIMNYNVIDTPKSIYLVPKMSLYPAQLAVVIDDYCAISAQFGDNAQRKYNGCLIVQGQSNQELFDTFRNSVGTESASPSVIAKYKPPSWPAGYPIIFPAPEVFSKDISTSLGMINVGAENPPAGTLEGYARHLFWLVELSKYQCTVIVPYIRTDIGVGTPVKISLTDNVSVGYAFSGSMYGVVTSIQIQADVNAAQATTTYTVSYVRTHKRQAANESEAMPPVGGFWNSFWRGCNLFGEEKG